MRTLVAIWAASVLLAGIGGFVYQSVGVAGVVTLGVAVAAGVAALVRARNSN